MQINYYTFYKTKMSRISNINKIIYQTMLSRNSINISQKALSFMEKQQLAKAALNFNKIITDPKTVHELVESSKIKIASSEIVNQSIKYLESENAGTTIMRTNLLASITTHLQYPVFEIEKHIKNTKINYIENAKNTMTPVRALIESIIINKFINKFDSYIENIQLTNDIVKVIPNNQKENSNPDAIITFKTTVGFIEKPMDIKMTNLENDYLRGHIREINVYGNEIVQYPNNHNIALHTYYNNMYDKLIKAITFQNISTVKAPNISSIPLKYQQKLQHLNKLITDSENNTALILKKHSEIENILMEINTMPGFPRTPTFINIHHIQNTPLTTDEMKFLELMVNKADINTLNKESYMTNYLIESLKLYHEVFNDKTYNNIKPLIKIYPWIKRGFNDLIPKDFYT